MHDFVPDFIMKEITHSCKTSWRWINAWPHSCLNAWTVQNLMWSQGLDVRTIPDVILKHWNDTFSLNIHAVVLEMSCFSSTDWTVRPAALTQSVPGVLLGGCEFRAKFLVQKCQHGSKLSQSPIGNLLSILMINGIALWMYDVAGILILHSAMQINLFFLLLLAFTCV